MGVLESTRAFFGFGTPAISSPFSDGQLQQIVWSEVFGTNTVPLSRMEALTVPALLKARNLICATVAKLPLRAQDKNGVLADAKQPAWLYRTDGAISPFLRMFYTIDDLLFYGRALWSVTRGSDGFILTAEWVPIARWKVTPEGSILVDDKPVNSDDVIYFPAASGGLLDTSAVSIRAAAAIGQAVANRASTPVPIMEIHATGIGDPITKKEAKAVVTDYNAARRDPEGATVFTPASVELVSHGDKADAGFMVEAQNSVRLNVANITGLPASVLDGSTATASLTYSTQEGRNVEFLDSLALWMETIAGRLSANDVVPNGQSVAFDIGDATAPVPSPTGATKLD
ncbi:MAG: phage portal protein [Rhodoglobus sp.]